MFILNVDHISFFRWTWWGEKYFVQEHKASKSSFLTGKYFAYYLLGSKKGWKSADMPEGAEESRIKVEYKALNFLDM